MSVLERFEQQATFFPDSIAVRFRGQCITYRQLNEQADRVAHALRNAGVQAETLVGVFLDRSAEMLVGLLGIWKAGGAYLPLDPALPSQRLSFMLEDCDVRYVLTEEALLTSLPKYKAQILCIEDALRGSPAKEGDLLLEQLPSERLAYVIYTSGSTGKPKGVEICHGGLANVVQAMNDDLKLSPSDIVLSITTIAFDISNLEFFLPLTQGACTYIAEQECARDGSLLMEVMKESGATLMLGTPTLWSLLLEAGWQGNPHLQVISGGEILPLSLGRSLAKMSRAVWNHYGPTETTICASTEKIEANTEKITIGSPLANIRFHILDSTFQPVLLGDTGEIYISGAGVGRGYIKRDSLNKACFFPDPFTPGARIYKTGDLGRELPGGRFEFLGRADEQVKIRGFRIELKEIEEAIREYEGVHAVSVQAMEVSPGDQRIIAYVQSLPPIEVAQLKEFLRRKLPSYMVPSEYIVIDSLPLTANGKVDRVALKAMKTRPIAASRTILQPRDEMEATLKSIWEKALKISPISVRDNFFELGGHSFLAAKLFAEMERKIGRKVPLSILIENPTIETLADCIREQEQSRVWPRVIRIQGEGERPPLFVAHGLGGSLLIFRALAERLGPDQPIYGLQIAPGMMDHKDQLSISELASIFIEQMKAEHPSGPYHIAGHSMGGLIAYEIASQLSQMGEEIGLLILFDCDLHTFGLSTSSSSVSLWEAIKIGALRLTSMFERASGARRNEFIQRKLFYEKLRLQITLLKYFPRAGQLFPSFFGEDIYVALSTQRYNPQSYSGDAVVFLAADQLRANRNFGSGWSQVVLGKLEIEKIPGTHQTMFTPPYVDLLAQELRRRLKLSNAVRARRNRPALTGS